jgi:hypothetical protein
MGGACGTCGVKRNACRVLIEKPESTRRSGRPKRRWEYNIKIDLKELVVQIGFIWVRMGADGRLLWLRQWALGVYKKREISWRDDYILAG